MKDDYKVVRVGGIVKAKLGPMSTDVVECKVESLVRVPDGVHQQSTTLTLARLVYKVEVRPSGRKLKGPDDFSQGPWEPGETRTVLLPGYDIHEVVS